MLCHRRVHLREGDPLGWSLHVEDRQSHPAGPRSVAVPVSLACPSFPTRSYFLASSPPSRSFLLILLHSFPPIPFMLLRHEASDRTPWGL